MSIKVVKLKIKTVLMDDVIWALKKHALSLREAGKYRCDFKADEIGRIVEQIIEQE